jgi:transcriptional regulator with XRE-family HTH domain
MRRLGKEKLADYVQRAMKQKQLKLRDVERRAGGKITNGYISGIINSRIKNVSMDKLKALAKGLDVDIYELVSAALDQPRQPADEVSSYERPEVIWVLGLMQQIVATPTLMKLLHDLVQLSPEDRDMVVRVIESIGKVNATRRTSRRKHA